jgi:hypothetical protein
MKLLVHSLLHISVRWSGVTVYSSSSDGRDAQADAGSCSNSWPMRSTHSGLHIICWLKWSSSQVLWLTPVILASQEAEVRRIMVWVQPRQNSLQDSILKIPITEHLPSKHEALSSNPSPVLQKHQKAKSIMYTMVSFMKKEQNISLLVYICLEKLWKDPEETGNIGSFWEEKATDGRELEESIFTVFFVSLCYDAVHIIYSRRKSQCLRFPHVPDFLNFSNTVDSLSS